MSKLVYGDYHADERAGAGYDRRAGPVAAGEAACAAWL